MLNMEKDGAVIHFFGYKFPGPDWVQAAEQTLASIRQLLNKPPQ